MSQPETIGPHLVLALLCGCALLMLAVASERQGEQLLGRLPVPAWRWTMRLIGWLLLGAALAYGIHGWGTGMGIVTWLGWLTPLALALVFLLPHWPARAPDRPASVRRAVPPPEGAALADRHGRAGWLLLALTAIGVGTALWRAEPQPLGRADAVHGTVGPWSFTLAQSSSDVAEIREMGVAVKAFQIRFCDACQPHIRHAWLKVGKPYLPREPGSAFTTQFGVQQAEIALPASLDSASTLWLTVMDKDGAMHQVSWRLDDVAPATVAWFGGRRDARQ